MVSKKENLNYLKDKEWGFLFALVANRSVALEPGKYVQVQSLNIPEDGLAVCLKKVGVSRYARTVFKNEFRYYAVSRPNEEELPVIGWGEFKRIHDQHWGIESYHRALKQMCNIECFQVRESRAKHPCFLCHSWVCSVGIPARSSQIINWYELRWNLFTHR